MKMLLPITFLLFFTYSDSIKMIYPFPRCRFPETDKNYFCRREYRCLGDDQINTACWRAPCRPTMSCGTHFKQLPMSKTDKEFVLKIHNTYRNRLSTGLEYRYSAADENVQEKYHPIVNMKILSYNDELEFLAQCWANYCLFEGWKRLHDGCKKTQMFSEIGQNFFLYTHVTPFIERINYSDPLYLGKAIDTWYQEIYKYNYSSHTKFRSNPETNNFTQMMWANTSAVGCARTQLGNGRVLRLAVYCNYAFRGNIENNPVFKVSAPQSTCCVECEGRMTYYYLFRGVDTFTLPSGDYKVRFPSAITKLQQVQNMGIDLSSKMEVSLTTHIYQFPGCNLVYTCLCGMTKNLIKINEYFNPPFVIEKSCQCQPNIFLILFIYLFCYFQNI